MEIASRVRHYDHTTRRESFWDGEVVKIGLSMVTVRITARVVDWKPQSGYLGTLAMFPAESLIVVR